MKLRVVRADGRPAGMGEVAVRTVLRVIDNYLVGLIVMLATGERRQRIGDLAAGTIVVDASGLAGRPRRRRPQWPSRSRSTSRPTSRTPSSREPRARARTAGRDQDDHAALAPGAARDAVRPDRARGEPPRTGPAPMESRPTSRAGRGACREVEPRRRVPLVAGAGRWSVEEPVRRGRAGGRVESAGSRRRGRGPIFPRSPRPRSRSLPMTSPPLTRSPRSRRAEELPRTTSRST